MKALWIGLAWGMALSWAVAAPLDAALDKRGAQSLVHAYDYPKEGLASLQELKAEEEASWGDWIPYLQARVGLLQGQFDAAQQWVRQSPRSVRARFVEGLLEERRGRNAEAALAASDVIQRLEPSCGAWAGVPPSGALTCDFRLAHDAWRLLSRTQQRGEQLANAQASVEKALHLSRAGKDDETVALDLAELASILEMRDKVDEAKKVLQEALQLARATPRILVRVKTYEADLLVRRGGDRAAHRGLLEEAMAVAERAQLPHLRAGLQVSLADAYLHSDQPQKAQKAMEEALPVLEKLGDPRTIRTARHNLAVAHIQQRHFDAAKAQVAILDRMTVGHDDLRSRTEEMRELGVAWARAGQSREALSLYHAERQLTQDAQRQAREAVLAELRAKYDADKQKSQVELLRRETEVRAQTLDNQGAARKVTVIAAVLAGLCAVIAMLALVRVRQAHTRLRANQALLQVLSERDPMTQLANRRHFLAAMQKRGAEPLTGALMMVDIDHFKRINDGYGHGAGDVVIQTVAKRLQGTMRDGDLLVRWGGEEFLVLAPSIKPSHIQLLADRLLQAVGSQPVVVNGKEQLRVTISVGFVCFPLPPADLSLHWERAVNWADLALYVAKHRGRNRAVGVGEAQAADEEALTRIEADFEGAAAAARIKLLQVNGPLGLEA
ncbi:tetratricopeptide repeat-containing diguanylate cyclase [Inhella gelatinilytica]|uniref:diguanylate cyclase n=1 Tax=Inhella gelatinilytica TaxID=2795030 RepID=A0A931IXX9_9BURK|nr:GGDEF domain-containing protein [Inhella gelatinilytica]MBH9553631.1 diguanylate cyclase [Inhella gelatinilytica]